MNLRWGAALALAAAVATSSCAAPVPRPSPPAIVSGPVHDLRTLADLAAVFNQDRDHPRIVLLLSPT